MQTHQQRAEVVPAAASGSPVGEEKGLARLTDSRGAAPGDRHHRRLLRREGTAALIEAQGFRFWAVSLHLKSGCFTDNDLTARDDCRTLARQIPVLEEWLDTKAATGIPVVLMGDFNRRLDRAVDVVRDDLDDGDPVDLFKVPHRQPLPCTAFSATPTVSIDYVIVTEPFWELVRVPEVPKLDVADAQLSDHCPVFVEVVLAE